MILLELLHYGRMHLPELAAVTLIEYHHYMLAVNLMRTVLGYEY